MLEYWKWMNYAWDLWVTYQTGPVAMKVRRQSRLSALLRFAREHSRFYRQHYSELPADLESMAALQLLPPVTKRNLMAHFDDWVTDPAVSRRDVETFTADLTRVGHPYLGRYAVWTSSGTTGEPGLFVHDNDALAVYDALQTVRLGRAALPANLFPGMVGQTGRFAMVGATGGHFAGTASGERLRRINPMLARNTRVFSILQPLPALVQQLNEFQPSRLATYPTALAVLAEEQDSGRLQIRPNALWSGGEWLSPVVRGAIERVFQIRVLEAYAASEFMGIACGCSQDWLHVNADWVILEPVDADYRPVPRGMPSRTVLLTNLANRVQPFIRYDLGDSIIVKPEPCACGSFLPAIRVEGRRDDTLTLQTAEGRSVRLLPLALATVIEEGTNLHRFQLIQTEPDTLSVRFDIPPGEDAHEVWRKVERCLQAYLAAQGLSTATVKRDRTPPRQDPVSGKFRQVIGNAA